MNIAPARDNFSFIPAVFDNEFQIKLLLNFYRLLWWVKLGIKMFLQTTDRFKSEKVTK